MRWMCLREEWSEVEGIWSCDPCFRLGKRFTSHHEGFLFVGCLSVTVQLKIFRLGCVVTFGRIKGWNCSECLYAHTCCLPSLVMCRRFWCRLHQQFLAGTVQTGPASFAHHQRRALHGRRHQDGRGQKLPTDAAVGFHVVILHVLDFSTHSHLSSYPLRPSVLRASTWSGSRSIPLGW